MGRIRVGKGKRRKLWKQTPIICSLDDSPISVFNLTDFLLFSIWVKLVFTVVS